jgi:Fe-S-cluster containining protein
MAEFYESGLKFSCKRCSACCRYESGYVFLSENDMTKLLNHLKMEKNDFMKTYCRWIRQPGNKEFLSLKEKSGKDCIFWDDGCTVYTGRPLQCVSFPFWADVVVSAKSWAAAASGCPGMNSGKLHTSKKIKEYLEMRTSEPIIYRSGGNK